MTQPFEDIRDRVSNDDVDDIWTTDVRRLLSAVDALMGVAELLHYSTKYGGSVTFEGKELGEALDALPPELKEALE